MDGLRSVPQLEHERFLDLLIPISNDEAIGMICFGEVQLSTIQVRDESYSDKPLRLCK